MKAKSPTTGLTELESHVLSLIWRMQPVSAYQIRQAFAHSPTRSVALSQGSIYPTVERLKRRNFIKATPQNDKRRTDHLSCTKDGEEAVKAWVRDLAVQIPEDPLRSRVSSLAILSKDERVAWVESAKSSILRDLANVEEFAQEYQGPLLDLAHDNARSTLLARFRWLERIKSKIETLD